MAQPDFGRPIAHPSPLVAHALHDDDANGDVVEAAVERKPTLTLGCRWRVPLTRVYNPSGVLLLYQDQLNAQTLDHEMVYVNVDSFIVV